MRHEWRKGPWAPEEDEKLKEHVKLHGDGRWSSVARLSGVEFNGVRLCIWLGLKRNPKSCRLRWVNYLRPGLKRAPFTPLEEGIIIELHAIWGNKWSTIARYLPGRTDNEIKNYWRTHFKKKETKPYPNCKHKKKLKALGSNDVFIEQNKQDQCHWPYEEERDGNTNDEQGHDSGNVEDQYFPLIPSYSEIPYWPNLVVGDDDLLLWGGGLWNFDDGLFVLS